MRRRGLLAFAAMLGAVGCTPYILMDNIPGPHGEPLVELACASPDQCMVFARETCHGDFDVVTNDYNAPRHIEVGSSANIMLVHCENGPGSPAAMHVPAPDGGP
jgi:hypothetical protein